MKPVGKCLHCQGNLLDDGEGDIRCLACGRTPQTGQLPPDMAWDENRGKYMPLQKEARVRKDDSKAVFR